jgi:hypothetical protein
LAAQYAAKRSGNNSGGQQQGKVGGEATAKCSNYKTDIKDDKNRFSVIPIENGCGQQSGDSGGTGVGGNQPAKMVRANIQGLENLGPQRHQYHEIDNAGELNCHQSDQNQPFHTWREISAFRFLRQSIGLGFFHLALIHWQ